MKRLHVLTIFGLFWLLMYIGFSYAFIMEGVNYEKDAANQIIMLNER